MPCFQLPATGFDDPPAEFTGEVGGFDEVDEAAGWEQPEVGVRPADQRFHAGDVTGDQRDFWLVVQDEGAGPDRGDQVQFDVGADLVAAGASLR